MLSLDNTIIEQFEKVKEEFLELKNEIKLLNYNGEIIHKIPNIENFRDEAFDVITATLNLLMLTKATNDDFKRHINKLNRYIVDKYKDVRSE